MTTAGRAKCLCDVPPPEESRGDDEESGEVDGEDGHRSLRSYRGGSGGAEGRGCEGVEKRVGVLSIEQVADPLVRTVVHTVDEAHQDDLQREQVNEADSQRRGRVLEQSAKGHAERAVDRKDQEDGGHTFAKVDQG